jgi:hypothetical protein
VGDLASAADAFDATSTAPPGTLASAADTFDSVKPAAASANDPTKPQVQQKSILHDITSLGAPIVGGYRGISEVLGRLASGSSVKEALEAGGAAATADTAARTYNAPTEDETPVSKAINKPSPLADYAPGQLLEKGADYVGEKTSNVLGPAAGAAAKTLIKVAPSLVGPKGMGEMAPEAAAPAAEATTAASAPAPAQASPGAAPAVSAPVASPAPAVPPIAPEITVPRENPPMPEQPLPAAQIEANKAALQKVGITDIRNSAIEQNPKEASSQYITQKADQGPYGTGMTAQINHEKTALDNHFGNIETAAGGQVVRYGTPEEVQDRIVEGQTVKGALQADKDAWNAQGHQLYQTADAEMAGKPIALDSLNSYLSADHNFAYGEEAGLRKGIQNYAQAKGLVNPDGTLAPMSVLDAEGIRQYINKKFSPATTGVSMDMKHAIDNDAFAQVSGPTYQEARAHWGQGKDTYENPTAMGKMLGDDGVNQPIPDEKVMPTLAALPDSQFTHIVDTLRAGGQTDALNQIQTSLVNQIKRAGQSEVNEPWNSRAAAATSVKLGSKLKTAFADQPDLLQKVYDGINAGNIAYIPTKYPGAAVQSHLLNNKFSENAIQKVTTGAGSLVGGTMGSLFGPTGTLGGGSAGAMVGEHFGMKAATAAKNARQTKQLWQEIQYNAGMSGLPK